MTPGLSVIMCYNCSKEGYKHFACSEPWKPSAIHEIDKQDWNLDVVEVTDEELGNENP